MDKKNIVEKIKKIRSDSKKRGFTQTFDLIVNLQNLDLKKPEHKVDTSIVLDNQIKDKKLKICCICDSQVQSPEEVFDKVIYNKELEELKGDMKKIREVTHNFDKFVVQVNYMPIFAQILGKFLGPLNKMPMPKLGMIISPKTDIKDLYDKLQKTVVIQTKKNLALQMSIGSEKESDDLIADNVLKVYDLLVSGLVNHQNNVKNVNLKLTMSKLEVL